MTVTQIRKQDKIAVAKWSELEDRAPTYALVADVDLVVLRYDDEVSVLYGRCLHRGALMADARVEGDNLICGVHGWDYRYDTGVSSYNNAEVLQKFRSWVDHDADAVLVDQAEIRTWAEQSPQPYDRDAYLGLYADVHGTPVEPFTQHIQELARNGLLITPTFGPRVRLAKVFTDLPLIPDKPIEFGVWDFCMICEKCAKKCPSQSIMYGKPTVKLHNISNREGLLRWPVNAETCLAFWAANGTDCSNCIRTCPFNKPTGRLHDSVRWGIKNLPFLNPLFLWGDDLLGYGKRGKADKFWKDTEC